MLCLAEAQVCLWGGQLVLVVGDLMLILVLSLVWLRVFLPVGCLILPWLIRLVRGGSLMRLASLNWMRTLLLLVPMRWLRLLLVGHGWAVRSSFLCCC